MGQLISKLHFFTGMVLRGVMMKTFGNCDSLITSLGRELSQNCWCLLARFIEISRHFFPIFDRIRLTNLKKCTFTSIMAPNAEIIFILPTSCKSCQGKHPRIRCARKKKNSKFPKLSAHPNKPQSNSKWARGLHWFLSFISC